MLLLVDVAKGVKMALGKRKREQQEAWIATTDLPKSPGHVFYEKLNKILAKAGFDEFVERLCQRYYAEKMGRPGIPPGVYFRMVFAGYFEGIDSQRGIAWRCSDSLSMKAFLGLAPYEKSPDHSSMTNTRKRLPLEVFTEVFSFVLAIAEVHKLLRGKTLGVDSTMLEANAAMKTIVRKDNGDDWNEYLRKLYAEETGDENPTDDDLRRFDRKRKDKKVSNDEWGSPSDPDARIAKMKDGRTHLAYKAEHAVDLDTEIVVAAEVYHANQGDQDTIQASMESAEDNLIRGEVDATPRRKSWATRATTRRKRSRSWSSLRAIAPTSPNRNSTGDATGNIAPKPIKRRPATTVAGRRAIAARRCTVCGASAWKGVSPTSAKRAEPDVAGSAGSTTFANVT